MKHFDDSTKKLIKNVAALLVSALVLIAATVAWFASGSRADLNSISAPMQRSNLSVKYYRTEVSDTFTYDSATGTVSGITLAQKMDLPTGQSGWVETENIDVPRLFPGEYNAFKITVHVNEAGTPVLTMKDFTCLYPTDSSIAYSSIFVSATAVSSDGTVLGSACGSLADLMTETEGSTVITPLSIGSQEANTDLVFYLDIGIPGEDVNDTHDDLRMTGAQIRINTVGVVS